MSLDMTPMTELDAVNVMLASIGQAPVNTLNVTGIRDVESARTVLHNQLRTVLAHGWHFNTDEGYVLAADIDGKIAVPTNALKLDPCDTSADMVQRKDNGTLRMWDRENHTFDIAANHDAPFEFDVTWLFEFEDIPQTARNYIGLRAARNFQTQVVGSTILYQFTREDELEARAEMERGEMEQSDLNILHDGTPQMAIWHRRFLPYT